MSADLSSLEILEPADNVNYGRVGLPSPRDAQIRALLLGLGNRSRLEQAVGSLPCGACAVLCAFAERAASLAVRRQDVTYLRAGLLGAVLAYEATDDARDVLPVMALLYRAAVMVGHDPVGEFTLVASWSGARAECLLTFCGRRAEDKAIEVMGYREADDGTGFRFARTW